MAKILPDTSVFIFATALGLVLGAILSYLFGAVALPTKIPFQFTIRGIPVNLVLVNILLSVFVGAIVFLGYVAAIVRDTDFPSKYPWLFVIETVLVAFVPASVLYIMTELRTGSIDFADLNSSFLLLAAKFGIFHLLFQFSGLYSYFFKE